MVAVEIKLLKSGDDAVLARVAPEVFDNDIDPILTREFLADPRHHIAVAVDNGLVVGFASGVDYIHPDKPRELFINEVAVAPTHHRRGIGKSLVAALTVHARDLGCANAWVLTDDDNAPARALYAAAGGTRQSPDALQFEFTL